MPDIWSNEVERAGTNLVFAEASPVYLPRYLEAMFLLTSKHSSRGVNFLHLDSRRLEFLEQLIFTIDSTEPARSWLEETASNHRFEMYVLT